MAESMIVQRLVRPVGAWLIACLASATAMMLMLAGIAVITETPSAGELADIAMGILPGAITVATIMAVLTALPTFALAWIMHLNRWKAVWISALLGATVGICTLQLFGFPAREGAQTLPLTLMVFSTGLIGGSVYRLVAGRG